jgi:hypothetical protein
MTTESWRHIYSFINLSLNPVHGVQPWIKKCLSNTESNAKSNKYKTNEKDKQYRTK